MHYSDLFSHPGEPEFVASGDTPRWTVDNPTFSDGPEANKRGPTPQSP